MKYERNTAGQLASRALPPSPHLDNILKNSNFFRESIPHLSSAIARVRYMLPGNNRFENDSQNSEIWADKHDPYLPQPTWAYPVAGLRGGEHIVQPPLSPITISRGWVELGFKFFLEITCLGVICHIQKDLWSLDSKNPPKNLWLLNFLLVDEVFRPVHKGPHMKFCYFRQAIFFQRKSVLPFSNFITEKSLVFPPWDI